MKRIGIVIAAAGFLSMAVATLIWTQQPPPKVHASDDGLAFTPPMGWYPWNEFGQEPQNEKLIKEIVDALVASGMRDAGYTYVGPDEGICFYRDNKRTLTTNLERYPSGLRGLGDYIHAKGLKYALYTDAGTHTCSKAMPGTKDHEFEDMRRFAEWRADYIKIDWCNTEGQDIVKTYKSLHDAQHAAGRPVVHSLCSWGEGSPWIWAAPIGHMWRTTGDICAPGKADWTKAMKIVAANEKLYPWAGPGHWNDPDMMIAGMDGLSEVQNRSFFSLWCMMAAPLMAGNDLRKMSKSTLAILTNLEAIGINQDPLGIQGRIVKRKGNITVWAGKKLFDGSQAVLVFNQGSSPEVINIKMAELGIEQKAAFYVRDLWTHTTSDSVLNPGGVLSVQVELDDVKMLRFSESRDFPIPPIVIADKYRLEFRASPKEPRPLPRAIVVRNRGTDQLFNWKVREGLPAWLTVMVTRDQKTQVFMNTVSTAGLKKGHYHALVRADNVERISGKPMSALYYDVDLEITDEK
jgi:alpha-galactosidase